MILRNRGMEKKQAEERQVEPQKQWREEGVENAQAEHRPCSGEESRGKKE